MGDLLIEWVPSGNQENASYGAAQSRFMFVASPLKKPNYENYRQGNSDFLCFR